MYLALSKLIPTAFSRRQTTTQRRRKPFTVDDKVEFLRESAREARCRLRPIDNCH
jgi:hypothetical protein